MRCDRGCRWDAQQLALHARLSDAVLAGDLIALGEGVVPATGVELRYATGLNVAAGDQDGGKLIGATDGGGRPQGAVDRGGVSG